MRLREAVLTLVTLLASLSTGSGFTLSLLVSFIALLLMLRLFCCHDNCTVLSSAKTVFEPSAVGVEIVGIACVAVSFGEWWT